MVQGLQRQELIELKFVARALNEILGTDYRVSVNGNTKIENDDKIEIAMSVTRIPFALTGIGSETLDMSLEVWSPADTLQVRDKVLCDLNALIGHRSGEIDAGERTYNFASFLEFGKPMSSPQVDMGTWKFLLSITGTMLVSDTITGAVISNAVLTQLFIGEPTSADTIQGFIPALSCNTALNFSTETMPIGNNNTTEVRHNMQGCNISLVSLVLNRPIDTAVLKIIHIIQDGFHLNSDIYIKKIYPTFESIKKCRLLGGEIDEQAGAYLQYKLSLQEVP